MLAEELGARHTFAPLYLRHPPLTLALARRVPVHDSRKRLVSEAFYRSDFERKTYGTKPH